MNTQLLNLFNPDDGIRSAAEKDIIQLKESDQAKYLSELVNVISCSNSDSRAVLAALVLTDQMMDHPCFCYFEYSFFDNLFFSVLQKIELKNPDISHAAANLLGVLLRFLVCKSDNPTDILNNFVNILNNAKDADYMHYIIVSLIRFLSTADLEKNQSRIVFKALFQLFQNPQFSLSSLQAFSAMAENITEATTPESKAVFLRQLLEHTSFFEFKVECYICWRRFLKEAFEFIQPVFDDVLKIAISDLSTSDNNDLLFTAIFFINSAINRQIKIKTHIFLNFQHFDALLMPLIRVSSLFQSDELDIKSDWSPNLSARETLTKLVSAFPEHAEKVLNPMIVEFLSKGNSVSLEISLYLLINLFEMKASIIPPHDFIISVVGSSLVHPNIRVRLAAVSAFYYFLESLSEEEKRLIIQHLDIDTFVPVLMAMANDPPPIAKKALQVVVLFDKMNINDLYQFYFNVINYNQDAKIVKCAFNCLEIIARKREMKEVYVLIEPALALLSNSVSNPNASFFFDSICGLMSSILENVKIAALPYMDAIISLYFQKIDPITVIYIAFLSKYFGQDFAPYLPKTIESIFQMLSEADNDEDIGHCCYAISVLSGSNLTEFQKIVQQTAMQLLSLYNDINSPIIFGLASLLMDYPHELIQMMQPVIDVVDKIFNKSIEGVNRFSDDVLVGSIRLIQTCYQQSKKDQRLIGIIYNILLTQKFIKMPSQEFIEAVFDLLLNLDMPLLIQFDSEPSLIKDIIEKSYKDLRNGSKDYENRQNSVLLEETCT